MVRTLVMVVLLALMTAACAEVGRGVIAEEEPVSQEEGTQAQEEARRREKEKILQARLVPMEERYVFSPKRVTSVEVTDPPVVDGRLNDACWQSLEPMGDFHLLGASGEPSQKTEVLLCHRGGVLYVAFRCHEAAMGERPTPEIPDYQPGDWHLQADTLQFYFSVGNDHTNYYRLVVGPTGHTKLFSGYRLRGELPTDALQNELKLLRGPSFACQVADEADAWTGEVVVPVSSLGVKGDSAGQVWGFDVVRVRRPAPEEVSAWCPSPESSTVFPLDSGELHFAQRDLTVVTTDLGKPFWGQNSAELTLTNSGPGPRTVRARSHVYLPLDEKTYQEAESIEQLAGGETRKIAVPYALSWRGRWPIYAAYCQRLTFRIEEAETGDVLSAASYPIAFDVGVKPNERYGRNPGAPNPSPGDPNFLAKKRDLIIGRIPEFRRLTTAEGAESDFVLAAADGSVHFNLMEEGAIQRIADWLHGLFDNDIDRMLGATFFVHQRTVTRHSDSLTRLGPMTPLSILRRGGGLCDSRTQALAGILSRMAQETTGEPYRCHCLGLKGHVVCAVEAVPEPKDVTQHWVLDPDVGVFYFVLDNTRFATLGQLRVHRQLSYRMNFNNVRHSHEFYFRTDDQFTYAWEEEEVWPEGAPPW